MIYISVINFIISFNFNSVYVFNRIFMCGAFIYRGVLYINVVSIVWMMILLLSNDFLTMYLALELQSLSLYVLASIKRNKILSLEAGLKYFATGSFSSGLLVFGISLMYGLLGQQIIQILCICYLLLR